MFVAKEIGIATCGKISLLATNIGKRINQNFINCDNQWFVRYKEKNKKKETSEKDKKFQIEVLKKKSKKSKKSEKKETTEKDKSFQIQASKKKKSKKKKKKKTKKKKKKEKTEK